MKKVVLSLVLAGLLAGSADAARIYLANSTDGSNGLTIPEGSSGDLDIRLDTSALDSIKVAFVNAFLDSDDDNLSVTATQGLGAPFGYDQSSFKFPAALSEDQGNEYALIMGDQTPGGGLPLGAATHVLDTLTVLNNFGQSGDKPVYFEASKFAGDPAPPRQPAAFGPAPTFSPYITAPWGFPAGFPGFLYVGSATSTNPAFIITKAVPEPATLGLLALGALVVIRRR